MRRLPLLALLALWGCAGATKAMNEQNQAHEDLLRGDFAACLAKTEASARYYEEQYKRVVPRMQAGDKVHPGPQLMSLAHVYSVRAKCLDGLGRRKEAVPVLENATAKAAEYCSRYYNKVWDAPVGPRVCGQAGDDTELLAKWKKELRK
jgi:hypothetical protein